MEQERFDRITRALTTRHSRRGVLKGMTGAALGGALAAVGLTRRERQGAVARRPTPNMARAGMPSAVPLIKPTMPSNKRLCHPNHLHS